MALDAHGDSGDNHVFLSYARGDSRELAERIRMALEADGVDVCRAWLFDAVEDFVAKSASKALLIEGDAGRQVGVPGQPDRAQSRRGGVRLLLLPGGYTRHAAAQRIRAHDCQHDRRPTPRLRGQAGRRRDRAAAAAGRSRARSSERLRTMCAHATEQSSSTRPRRSPFGDRRAGRSHSARAGSPG